MLADVSSPNTIRKGPRMSNPIFPVWFSRDLSAAAAQRADTFTIIYSSRVRAQSLPWIAQEAGPFKKYNIDHSLVFIASSSIVTPRCCHAEQKRSICFSSKEKADSSVEFLLSLTKGLRMTFKGNAVHTFDFQRRRFSRIVFSFHRRMKMSDKDLLKVLGDELGQATATVIVAEHPRDRRFIGETLLAAAALYLLKKYLDGFVDGLGIKKLGEAHGALALKTAKDAVEVLQAKEEAVDAALRKYLPSLQEHRDNQQSRKKGEDAVVGFLGERGVPAGQAKQIAEKIHSEMFDDR
jgi:hypothetical protein